MALIVHTEHPMHHFTPFGNKIISKIEINIRSINILFHFSFLAFTVSLFFFFSIKWDEWTTDRKKMKKEKCQKRKRSNEKLCPSCTVYCVRLMMRVRSFTFIYVRVCVFAFVCAIWWNRYFGNMYNSTLCAPFRWLHSHILL